MFIRNPLTGIIWLLILICLLSACSQQRIEPQSLLISGSTMGTTYTIKINERGPEIQPDILHEAIDDILEQINDEMSTYKHNSVLNRINFHQTSDWQPLTPDLLEVLNQALHVSLMTSGAFDITIGPLVNLWGFGPDGQTAFVPSDETISNMLKQTGFHYIQLNSQPPAIRKERKDLYLDLSGIAKGYGVDKIAAYLDSLNLKNYMVEIGGEIRARGVNEKNNIWRIGIEKPVDQQRSVQRIIQLQDISMATSGDYRNYFELNGHRYSHTIDPHTGRPITHTLASVTVLHESSSMADALATALLVLGPDAGYKFSKKEDIAALFINKNNSGFDEKMTFPFQRYLLTEP